MLNGAIAGPLPHSDEWYRLRSLDLGRKERPVIFGASDAADVCNVGYKSALQVYMEKRGEMPAAEDTEVSRRKKRMGLRLEGPILDEYAEETDVTVERGLPMFFHKKHSFMAATPDGFVRMKNPAKKKSPVWGVDAKNSTSRMFDPTGQDENKYGEEGTDSVPLIALFQGQHNCEVFGFDRTDFAVLQDGFHLRVYSVQRNDELIAQIVAAEKELAERILDGRPPEPNYRHPGTRDCLKRLFGCQIGTVKRLGPEYREKWLKIEQLRESAKIATEEMDALKNELAWAAEDAQFVEFEESEIRLKKIVVADSLVTQKDVDALQARVGQVGRRGSQRLQRVKSQK